MPSKIRSEDPSIPLILGHPATFGKRWTSNPAVRLYKSSWDLCNETTGDPDNLDNIIPDSNFTNQTTLYGIALYFDPLERTDGRVECPYSTMAQVAEKKYPTTQYLLVRGTYLVSMRKADEEPDTILALATVTLDDGNAIYTMLGNELTPVAGSGSLLVSIDATTRSYLDVGDPDFVAGNRLWSLIAQITGTMSFLGSLYVICSLIGTKKRRSKNLRVAFNRLLLAISISDMMSSTAMMFSAWAVPSTPPGDYEGYYSVERWKAKQPGAIGTYETCQAQAFFVHTGLSCSAFLTGFVAVHTLLMVRYAWTAKKMEKAEYIFFCCAPFLALVTWVGTVAAKMYRPMASGFCWVYDAVEDCAIDDRGPLLDEYCDEFPSTNHVLIVQMLLLAFIMMTLVIILYCMASVFLFVRGRERQAARWSSNAQEGRQQKRVLTKSMTIIAAYWCTWAYPVFSLTPLGKGLHPDLRNIPAALSLPLQGFFNALIFSGFAAKFVEGVLFGKHSPLRDLPSSTPSQIESSIPKSSVGGSHHES